MPLIIDRSNLSGWKKFAADYYYYPTNTKEDSDNHIHVRTTASGVDKAEILSISVKINGVSTNLAIGNPANKFMFKPDAATWPADSKTRYMTALRNAGLIA